MHIHNDVIQWKHFPRHWPFVRGIHRSPVNSPHKGQWRGALMFSLLCAWMNGWVNTSEVGDLRRYRAHYDVIIIILYGVYCKCYEVTQCNIRDRSVSFKATSGMTISFIWYINDCPGQAWNQRQLFSVFSYFVSRPVTSSLSCFWDISATEWFPRETYLMDSPDWLQFQSFPE